MFKKVAAVELKPGDRLCVRGPQNALRIETVKRRSFADEFHVEIVTECGGFVAVGTREIECSMVLKADDEVEVLA